MFKKIKEKAINWLMKDVNLKVNSLKVLSPNTVLTDSIDSNGSSFIGIAKPIAISNQPHCLIYRATDLDIAEASDVVVTWDGIWHDESGMFDSSTSADINTLPSPDGDGFYLITSYITWKNIPAGTSVNSKIEYTDSSVTDYPIIANFSIVPETSVFTVITNSIVYLPGDAAIRAHVYQSGNGTQTIIGDGNRTFFRIFKLS